MTTATTEAPELHRLNLQSEHASHYKVGANSSTSQTREGTSRLFSSRRAFLQSLSRSALVLSLENVLALARPTRLHASLQASATPKTADLGMSFINIARESGLNAKTIYGGGHKTKYLRETTGCGVAFYDYDNDGWLDIFLVNGTPAEGFRKGPVPTTRLFTITRYGIC